MNKRLKKHIADYYKFSDRFKLTEDPMDMNKMLHKVKLILAYLKRDK